jgi:hypothetical protein
MAAPPLLVGGSHDKFAFLSSAVAVKFNGVPGTARGVTAGDDFNDHAPVSTAFFAATWNEYAVPFESPVTFTVAVIDVEVVLRQSEYQVSQIGSNEEPGGGSPCILLETHD